MVELCLGIKVAKDLYLMQPIISQINKLLIKNQKTIAVAESCTTGLLSNLLTQIPGSSQYFILGAVVYSNQAKETFLKIPAHLMSKKGAVSKEVAKKMAQSVKKLAKTDLGVGITGIAGPSGGTRKKPVGTVFIAIISENQQICERFLFKGSRLKVRKMAALKALKLLNRILQK